MAHIPAPDRPLARALPEGWGAHHDNRLRDAGGRYAALAALAAEWGIETRVLLARWHRLRAGAVGGGGTVGRIPVARVDPDKAARAQSRALARAKARAARAPLLAMPAAAALRGRVSPMEAAIVGALEQAGREMDNPELARALDTTLNTVSAMLCRAGAAGRLDAALRAVGWRLDRRHEASPGRPAAWLWRLRRAR